MKNEQQALTTLSSNRKIISCKFLVLFLDDLFDSEQSLLGRDCAVGRELPRAAHDGPQTGLALPNADRLSLHLVLAAELAVVLSVLGDLVLLDDLPQRASVPRSELSDDALFLSPSCHVVYKKRLINKTKKIIKHDQTDERPDQPGH